MKKTYDLSLPASVEEMLSMQIYLKQKLTIGMQNPLPKYVAGVDTSYDKNGRAVCCIVVMEYDTLSVVEIVMGEGESTIPYQYGFLSFKEMPLFLDTWEKLAMTPDVVFFDGNGVLHPRGFGMACHASLEIGLPTIGISKSGKYNHVQPEKGAGSSTLIWNKDGVTGCCLRTKEDTNPVFVSVGNLCNLSWATTLSLHLSQPDGVYMKETSRIPSIVRIPDMLSRQRLSTWT